MVYDENVDILKCWTLLPSEKWSINGRIKTTATSESISMLSLAAFPAFSPAVMVVNVATGLWTSRSFDVKYKQVAARLCCCCCCCWHDGMPASSSQAIVRLLLLFRNQYLSSFPTIWLHNMSPLPAWAAVPPALSPPTVWWQLRKHPF